MNTFSSPTASTPRGSRRGWWRRPVAGLVAVAVLLALVVAAAPLHAQMASPSATPSAQSERPCSETCPFEQLHDALAADQAVVRVPFLPFVVLLAVFVAAAAPAIRRGDFRPVRLPSGRLHVLLRTFRC